MLTASNTATAVDSNRPGLLPREQQATERAHICAYPLPLEVEICNRSPFTRNSDDSMEGHGNVEDDVTTVPFPALLVETTPATTEKVKRD